jgi:hypothetical protein
VTVSIITGSPDAFSKKLDNHVKIVLLALVGAAAVVMIMPHIWTYYIAPRDALAILVNKCETEGNKVYGLDMAKWAEVNKTEAFSPFRRKRDEYIESCVKAEGWCSLGDDGIWPSSRPWAFAPRDRLAKWLYDARYYGGEHSDCTD